MSQIVLLPPERWGELAEIFEKEFDSALPAPGTANIVASLNESGEVEAFILTEVLVRVGLVWNGAQSQKRTPYKLIKYVEQSIPKGASAVAIASEERFGGLFEKFGMTEVEGKLYRRDF